MSFSDEDYQQNCTAALEIMEIETPFILYTWIRNTLLECLEHADMIMDMDGFQVDAGTAPVRDDPDRPYPAFYAHMANDPFGSSEETNCVNFNGGLRATRHIFPGEEILWDYGPSYHMDLTARMTRTVREDVIHKNSKIGKVAGLLRFMEDVNFHSTNGYWPNEDKNRTPATRVQPTRKSKQRLSHSKQFVLNEVDIHMLELVGLTSSPTVRRQA
eukprot:jgi/Mesvir1/9824/Mv03481-RA.1